MKKALHLFVLLTVAALVLSACAPIAQSLIALPDEASLLIVMLVTSAVAWLLLKLSTLLKFDLGGYVQPIVAVVAPILITLIESYLQLIPPALDNVVLTVIHLIVLLVGSVGAFILFKRRASKTLLSCDKDV